MRPRTHVDVPQTLPRAAWYRALTLDERLGVLQRFRHRIPAGSATHPKRAAERLATWRGETSLKEASPIVDPLELHNCSEAELLMVLDERAAGLRDFPPVPFWVRQLDEAVAYSASKVRIETATDGPGVDFLVVLEGPIRQAKGNLRKVAMSLKRPRRHTPFDPGSVSDVLFEHLVPRLSRLLVRPLVVELHALRLRDRLPGSTAEERFEAFVDYLRGRRQRQRLLREYPVLARLAMSALADWVNTSAELLKRLADDFETVSAAVGLAESDIIKSVQLLGDRHRGGRAVLCVGFESGTAVVYKPRSVATEEHFQALLRWLNDVADVPTLRELVVLRRRGYGWEEFVRPEPCASRAELRRFYQRQGALMALLYGVAASDFHHENVIAAGEHPVLVDLECLFQSFEPGPAPSVSGVEEVASTMVRDSVLEIGLLPRPEVLGDERVTDLSGLGAYGRQIAPVRIPTWEGNRTDEMRQALVYGEPFQTGNRPSLTDQAIDLVDFSDDIIAGFREAYYALWRHRDYLRTPSSPIHAFARDEVRCVLRPTLEYALLLESSLHPHFLHDGLDRDERFDRIMGAKSSWRGYEAGAAERRDLWRGDIPIFVTRPDSKDIWTSEGRRIPGVLQETGLDVVRGRLQRLSANDLERQCWMIRMSIASGGLTPETLEFPRRKRVAPARGVATNDLLLAARGIGDRLGELAIRRNREVTWIGVKSDRGRRWQIQPVGSDLYGGLTGIALFLSYLGAIVDDERYIELAQASFPPLRRQLARDVEERLDRIPSGAFSGLGGVIYALVHLSALWSDTGPLRDARLLLKSLPQTIDNTPRFDIISGAAGCIAALLPVLKFLERDLAVDVVKRSVKELLRSAVQMDRGIAWPAPVHDWPPLGGLAHGAAGIAWALLAASKLAGDESSRRAGLDAIEYQRSLFSGSNRNWKDMRRLPGERESTGDQFTSFWCHGSAGVLLAWIGCSRHVNETTLRADAEIAARTTLRTGFGFSHCLCHGDLGNADALLTARAEGLTSALTDRRAISAQIFGSIRKRGWLTGFPLGLEAPGLMMGLAGIGYGLLRLAEPERVPSILLLDPPNSEA